MAIMLGALYGALRDAGVSDERAQKASEEVAAFKEDIMSLKSDMTLVKWMLGFTLAFVVAILGLLLKGMH